LGVLAQGSCLKFIVLGKLRIGGSLEPGFGLTRIALTRRVAAADDDGVVSFTELSPEFCTKITLIEV